MPLAPHRILIVDDDRDILTTARMFLKHQFEGVKTSMHPSEALELMDQFHPDVVLLDMNFQRGENSGWEGLNALRQLLQKDPSLKVILLTAYGDIGLAVEAIKAGGADFVVKPWSNEQLLNTILNALKLKEAERNAEKFKAIGTGAAGLVGESELIGESGVFRALLQQAAKVAPTDASVLLLGENGTGKDVMARYIHSHSERKNEVFFRVDVGALHEQVFESELFGHVKGAFTDAKEDKPGKLEMADGGTLFLDEIGNLSLSLQVKLLTALQQRVVTRVGSSKPVPTNFRLICATNMNLAGMVDSGEFRQDLLFRINTIELTVPSLRQRKDDIPALARHFASHFARKYKKPAITLSDRVLDLLTEHSWPGNVRELMHTMERAVIMADGPTLHYVDLGPTSQRTTPESPSLNLQENELRLIQEALRKNQGNVTRAARELGIDRLALYRRMEKYGIK